MSQEYIKNTVFHWNGWFFFFSGVLVLFIAFWLYIFISSENFLCWEQLSNVPSLSCFCLTKFKVCLFFSPLRWGHSGRAQWVLFIPVRLHPPHIDRRLTFHPELWVIELPVVDAGPRSRSSKCSNTCLRELGGRCLTCSRVEPLRGYFCRRLVLIPNKSLKFTCNLLVWWMKSF